MKKYTNVSNGLRAVAFSDGLTQFLTRGQSVQSSKSTRRIDAGIKVEDVKVKASSKKTSIEDAPSDYQEHSE